MPAAGEKLSILHRRRPFLGVFWGKKLLPKGKCPPQAENFGNLGFATITAKSQNLDDFAPITGTFEFSRNGFCHNNCRAHFQILGSGLVLKGGVVIRISTVSGILLIYQG